MRKMATTLPYVFSPGALTRVLEKIRAAAVPDKFTQNFLADTLGMKGGSPSLLIPYLKKIGFLNGDGTPTEIYKRFRNPSVSKAAVADAMRLGYAPLFAMNENAYQLPDRELQGLLVQATGMEPTSSPVKAMIACFKTLKGMADFSDTATVEARPPSPIPNPDPPEPAAQSKSLAAIPPPTPTTPGVAAGESGVGLNLSYTINLQLPSTADINVFNAIFRSLKENLLRR